MTFYNIVKQNTATVGTGTIALGSAVPGFITFSDASVPNGATVSYAIEDVTAGREVGTGVYNSGTQQLTRSVATSTNSNNLISLSGSAVVFITALAADLNSDSAATASTLLKRDAAGVATSSAYAVDYAVIAGDNTVTPDSSNGYTEIILDRASTTIAAPLYNGGATLKTGVIFSVKLRHTLAGSDVVWNTAYRGASSFPPSGVNGEYSVYTFICRSASVVELIGIPLIGVAN